VLGVFGLLSVLLTIGILGILGARVVSSLNDKDGIAGVSAGGVSGDTTATDDVAAAGGASCAIERRTLETAVQAYRATNGGAPADQAAIVAAGILDAPVTSFEYRPGAPEELTGLGECAGT